MEKVKFAGESLHQKPDWEGEHFRKGRSTALDSRLMDGGESKQGDVRKHNRKEGLLERGAEGYEEELHVCKRRVAEPTKASRASLRGTKEASKTLQSRVLNSKSWGGGVWDVLV